MKIKIGFTGTRRGMTRLQKNSLIKFLVNFQVDEFHHGDCIGADEEAHELVDNSETESIQIHPPINSDKRAWCTAKYTKHVIWKPKPYIARNHDIVDAIDILIACPGESDEQLRSGTWSTIRYAKKKNKTINIIFPDGSIKKGI